jgi:recombination protein RecA
MFGNPETTTGGNALKFYSSVRLEVRKTETIEGGKDTDAVGNRVRVKVVKNKVAPPFRRAELDVIFGKGVSASASLLDAAVKYALIDKKGAWYSYGEEKVGQGRDSAREYLEQNPAFARELEVKIRKLMFPGREFPAGKAAPGPAAKPAPAGGDPGPVEIPAAVEVPALNTAPPLSAAVPEPFEAPRVEAPPQPVPRVEAPLQPAPRVEAPPQLAPRVEVPPQPAPRPPSPAPQEAPIRRGPGRPPANAGRPASPPRPAQGPGPGEVPHRGPGRPRKAAPGGGEDALF